MAGLGGLFDILLRGDDLVHLLFRRQVGLSDRPVQGVDVVEEGVHVEGGRADSGPHLSHIPAQLALAELFLHGGQVPLGRVHRDLDIVHVVVEGEPGHLNLISGLVERGPGGINPLAGLGGIGLSLADGPEQDLVSGNDGVDGLLIGQNLPVQVLHVGDNAFNAAGGLDGNLDTVCRVKDLADNDAGQLLVQGLVNFLDDGVGNLRRDGIFLLILVEKDRRLVDAGLEEVQNPVGKVRFNHDGGVVFARADPGESLLLRIREDPVDGVVSLHLFLQLIADIFREAVDSGPLVRRIEGNF